MTNKKQTILCTWEMGSELGHLSRLSAITQGLTEDFQTAVAAKDLSRAYPFFAGSNTQVLQAPIWLPKIRMQRPIACLADTLLLMGYLEPDPLHSLIKAWQGLAELIKPDLVIYDYSPTAMLAMRHLNIPKINVGTGFSEAVPGKPILDWRPQFVEQTNTQGELIRRQESKVLENINVVQARLGQPPLNRLSDIYSTDYTLLNTFPDLDLYRNTREQAEYCLKQNAPAYKRTIRFPNNNQQNILAYIKPQHPQLPMLLQTLARFPANSIAVCPSNGAEQLLKYQSTSLQIITELVDLQSAMDQADLFIGHGNMSSTCESLQAGKPLMVLPIQLEQLLNGKNIERLKLGKLMEKIDTPEMLVTNLDELLKERHYKDNVEKFSQDNQQYWKNSLPERTKALCKQLLGL